MKSDAVFLLRALTPGTCFRVRDNDIVWKVISIESVYSHAVLSRFWGENLPGPSSTLLDKDMVLIWVVDAHSKLTPKHERFWVGDNPDDPTGKYFLPLHDVDIVYQ